MVFFFICPGCSVQTWQCSKMCFATQKLACCMHAFFFFIFICESVNDFLAKALTLNFTRKKKKKNLAMRGFYPWDPSWIRCDITKPPHGSFRYISHPTNLLSLKTAIRACLNARSSLTEVRRCHRTVTPYARTLSPRNRTNYRSSKLGPSCARASLIPWEVICIPSLFGHI